MSRGGNKSTAGAAYAAGQGKLVLKALLLCALLSFSPPPPKLLKLGFGGTNAFRAAAVALLVFGWTTATGFHTAILLSTFTVS